MGHHYVPQAYLRAFSEAGSDDMIWMYDRAKCTWSRAAIDKVAQEKGYYAPDVEDFLGEKIEKPANAVLAKLRAGALPSSDERLTLSLYLGTMIERVPRRRRKGLDLLPSAIDNTLAEFRASLAEACRGQGRDEADVMKHDALLTRLRQRMLANPPQEVLGNLRTPWPSQEMVTLLALMSWRFVRATGQDKFLTSDNPAFFFEGLGLRKVDAEITFPLAPDLALFGSWQGQLSATMFVSARPQLVKEGVRRIISTAERFIFSVAEWDWVKTVAIKQHPYLSKVQW